MKELVQLHHELRDGATVFVTQVEADTMADAAAEIEEASRHRPLPRGAQWLIVRRGSPYFVVSPLDF